MNSDPTPAAARKLLASPEPGILGVPFNPHFAAAIKAATAAAFADYDREMMARRYQASMFSVGVHSSPSTFFPN